MNPLPILRDAWYFFSRNLGDIARLCLPLIILENLAQQGALAWASEASAPTYQVLIGLLFYPVYSAALILYLDARSRGLRPRARDLLTMAMWLWPTFALLVGLCTLLIMLGASLLLLPGLWVMIKLAFAEYLLVLRGLTPLEALKESYRQTTGHFWTLLFCVLTVMLPLLALDWWSYPGEGQTANLPFTLLLDSLNGFLLLFSTVVLFRVFMLLQEPQVNDA
ncbi:MAG: hypothetical protein ABWY06_21455 [Pseudomonas sp.]|uniref:hypothetical protein n=1 Tax=Pseudomonas sp. TaxID=306 RepID=UPI003393B879